MKIKITFSNDDDTLRMNHCFTIETFKDLLKNEPLALLNIIEGIEKQYKTSGRPFRGDYSEPSNQVIVV